jgi:2Fe-2S ferredoxin
MPKLVFIEHNGTQHEITAAVGTSLMQAALDNAVPGILADCGGCCVCGTCQVYIDPSWLEKLPPPDSSEQSLLEALTHVREESRIACQISITADMDGLVLRVPESQY